MATSAPDSSGISLPPPPPTLNRISALIDPNDYDDSRRPYFHRSGTVRNATVYPSFNPYAYSSPSLPSEQQPSTKPLKKFLVESPSGNTLDRAEYLAHPDRPLTIRERQENIRLKLKEAHEQRLREKANKKKFFQSSPNLAAEGSGELLAPVKEADEEAGHRHSGRSFGRISLSKERSASRGFSESRAPAGKDRGCLGGLLGLFR